MAMMNMYIFNLSKLTHRKEYKMKHLKNLSSVFWLMLVASLILMLTGCGTPIATPVSTTTPVQDIPTAQTPATIRGIITYQAPPTPTSMLYLISPERWYA